MYHGPFTCRRTMGNKPTRIVHVRLVFARNMSAILAQMYLMGRVGDGVIGQLYIYYIRCDIFLFKHSNHV